MRKALLEWFDANARDLPWRRGPDAGDPYRVLVAEVVLQQTQVSRAGPAYERLLERFPNLERLATAEADAVLEAWHGIGYYQRAQRLQRSAQVVVERHGGELPRDPAALRELPGVGRYTARAVAARAFGAALVAVDANVRRVGARVLDLAVPSDQAVESGLERLLLAGTPTGPAVGPDGAAGDRRGEVSEALIELGAIVCRPRAPACWSCPLSAACQAHRAGRATSRPTARRRSARRHERLPLLVVLRDGAAALVRRPSRGRWAGLWGFPSGDAAGEPLPSFRHQLTHRTLDVSPTLVSIDALDVAPTWVPLERVAAGGAGHPVAAVDRRLARLLLASPLASAQAQGLTP